MSEVDWERLQHAYGSAEDVPELLERIARTRASKLAPLMDDLYSRVLHQGSLYSASPPVAQWLADSIPEADAGHRAFYYSMLGAFADSVRADDSQGRDAAIGVPIRTVIHGAEERALQDLAHDDAGVRWGAAQVAGSLGGLSREAAETLRARWSAEPDASVRGALMEALTRSRESVRDWTGFLRQASEGERDRNNRYALLRELVRAGHGGLEALASAWAAVDVEAEEFIEALPSEGRRRAMLHALGEVKDDTRRLKLAGHLLRSVFHDRRDGWGCTTSRRLRADGSEPARPSVTKMALVAIVRLILLRLAQGPLGRWVHSGVRRRVRHPAKGILVIEYPRVQETPPAFPEAWSPDQREVLEALVRCEGVWRVRTNLWALFGLPADREGLRALLSRG